MFDTFPSYFSRLELHRKDIDLKSRDSSFTIRWIMPLELDGYVIEDIFVNAGFDANQDVYFTGRALDEDGRKLCNTLKSMKGKILEVKLDDREGIYEFHELKIKPREEIRKGCYIYRFSGRLRPVH